MYGNGVVALNQAAVDDSENLVGAVGFPNSAICRGGEFFQVPQLLGVEAGVVGEADC